MSQDRGIDIQIERLTEMHCAQCGTRLDVSVLEPFAGVECPSCGNQDTVPARFGQFLLLNLISTGGMGGVYRGRDESLGRLVAIKVMLHKLGENAEFVANFKREAQAAARLNHPNVAQIYSYGQVNGQPFIVMELVSGHRFDRLIENSPSGLDPALVLRVAVDIAEGLQAAEEIGLVHGDIKPENILLDDKRKAKLVDFGIASFADQAASEGVWGSPYYIAPERARGRKSDARSDIYSLGATVYHALAGRPPFDGETPIDVVKARLTKDPPPLDGIRPGLPKPLIETLQRMLAREPAQRHPTYASLLGDLRRSLQEVPASGGGAMRTASGKRVVLKKKEPAGLATASGRIRVPRAGGEPFPKVEEQMEILRARRRKQTLVTGAIIGVLALVAGGAIVFTSVRAKRAEAEAARRNAAALQQAVTQAVEVHAALGLAATNAVRQLAAFDPALAAARRTLGEIETLSGDAATNAASGEGATPVQVARACVTNMDAHVAAARQAAERIATIVAAADALLAGATNATKRDDVAKRESELREQQALVADAERAIQAELLEVRTLGGTLAPLEKSLRAAQAQRLQEEARQREAQAERDKVAAELETVKALAARTSGGVPRLAMRDALRETRSAGRHLKSTEAQAAHATLLNRYERLDGLRVFLIEQLNLQPYAWGWKRPGGAAEDIMGAEERGVKLRNRTVGWADISVPQFVAIVEHCVSKKGVKRSTQADQYLAAAIYCLDRGNVEAAQKFRDKAVSITPSLKDPAAKLLGE